MSWLEDIIKQSQAFVASQTPEERATTQAQMDASRALSTAQYESNIAAKPTTFTPIVAGKDMPQAYADMMNARMKSAVDFTRGIPRETGTHLVTNPATGLQYDITSKQGGTNQALAAAVNAGNWGALPRATPQQNTMTQWQPQQRQQYPQQGYRNYGTQGMFGGTASSRQPYTGYQAYQPYQGQQRTQGMFGAPTMNYNMRNRPMQPQNPIGSQTNPWSM